MYIDLLSVWLCFHLFVVANEANILLSYLYIYTLSNLCTRVVYIQQNTHILYF